MNKEGKPPIATNQSRHLRKREKFLESAATFSDIQKFEYFHSVSIHSAVSFSQFHSIGSTIIGEPAR